MGSLFAPKQKVPPPPSVPLSTYRDEVNNVEQIPVTQPDGTVTYITRKLPLSAEEQARQDKIDAIMDEALAEMQKLSSTDYQHDEATQKILADWEKEQEKRLLETQRARTKDEEAALARRGLNDSTVGDQIRRQRRLDAQDDAERLDDGREELGSQIRSQRYGLQQNLFNVAANAESADKAAASASASRGLSAAVAQDQARQASLLDYYSRQQSTTTSGNYSVLGKLVGTATNVVGAGSGGMLGSWLWRR
ncbi:MAG: hypothetical protein COY40_03020 [Alphaproteobacteria bacterium CG_4_10_14_0_8_um_filter_53_9]|nr:MAG: hypothetical protein COY40_03020 [Alphaproteobacteria bacterium CG_4_10_14_0_8_um_filter_53_9]